MATAILVFLVYPLTVGDRTYRKIVPKQEHKISDIWQGKMDELEKLEKFEAYELVEEVGQSLIDTV